MTRHLRAGGSFALAALVCLVVLVPIRAALAACQVTVAGGAPGFVPAGFAAAVPAGSVRLTFAGHASFMIESPEGVGVFTDYNGYIKPHRWPEIVTMNRFHRTHWTDRVEPEIGQVLRGWNPSGGVPHHDIKIKDTRIRNVPTNFGEVAGDLGTAGNSIFIIEAAGVCVVHLSHTHHVLAPEQVQPIKDADVLLVPIDGMWTMSHEEAFHIIEQVKPRLIIPMHYGSTMSIEQFTARARALFPVAHHPSDTIEVSLKTLPRATEVLFLKTTIY